MKIRLQTRYRPEDIEYSLHLRFDKIEDPRTMPIESRIQYKSNDLMFSDLHMLIYLMYTKHADILSDPIQITNYIALYGGMDRYVDRSSRIKRIQKILKLNEGVILKDFTLKYSIEGSYAEKLVTVMVKSYTSWDEHVMFSSSSMPLFANYNLAQAVTTWS